MSVDGEMFTQVLVAAKARSGRLSARKLMQPRPLISPKYSALLQKYDRRIRCQEPHLALTNYVVDALAQGNLEYYGCGVQHEAGAR